MQVDTSSSPPAYTLVPRFRGTQTGSLWLSIFASGIPLWFGIFAALFSCCPNREFAGHASGQTQSQSQPQSQPQAVARRDHDQVRERNMTEQEKKDFDMANDEALIPWIKNVAWVAVYASEAREGEAVRVRFLLKYKQKDGQQKANARLILQFFRHIDVTSKTLETESPTLAKGARSLILLLCCQMGWKVFSPDVKSAFLQSDDIDQDIRLFAVPNRDIRQRLVRLMGLKDFQILRIKKPAFGDVRAPRQWYTTADRVNQDVRAVLREAQA